MDRFMAHQISVAIKTFEISRCFVEIQKKKELVSLFVTKIKIIDLRKPKVLLNSIEIKSKNAPEFVVVIFMSVYLKLYLFNRHFH